MKLSETPGEPGESAPLLGQHTHEVLKELLRLDHAAFHSLAEKAIVYEPKTPASST